MIEPEQAGKARILLVDDDGKLAGLVTLVARRRKATGRSRSCCRTAMA